MEIHSHATPAPGAGSAANAHVQGATSGGTAGDNAIPEAAQAARQVSAGDFVTLRYRIALADGQEVVSTFGMNPATFQLGTGQLAPTLENCLLGMADGARDTFTLEPEAAFGRHNPELVQRIALAALPRELEEEPGAAVAFTDTSGKEFAGTLLEKGESHATFDFNHPLAGKTVVFEAQIIGIL
jgi:FKBP-type peptidyl-prolyl cis-trans isomerase SlpA